MRSGAKAKAYRYRLHNKEGMIKLIQCINGNIRHSLASMEVTHSHMRLSRTC